MAGQKIKTPYNIILAGDHDAGKTTIFQTLKTCFEEGNSGKFQLVQEKRELRFESCLHKYLDSSKKPKVCESKCPTYTLGNSICCKHLVQNERKRERERMNEG